MGRGLAIDLFRQVGKVGGDVETPDIARSTIIVREDLSVADAAPEDGGPARDSLSTFKDVDSLAVFTAMLFDGDPNIFNYAALNFGDSAPTVSGSGVRCPGTLGAYDLARSHAELVVGGFMLVQDPTSPAVKATFLSHFDVYPGAAPHIIALLIEAGLAGRTKAGHYIVIVLTERPDLVTESNMPGLRLIASGNREIAELLERIKIE